jgi:hypothetical protein
MKILDRLIGSLRGCCHSLPDLRQGGDVRYTMVDIGLSAFSLFFLQSPSFLAHQRRLEEGQGRSNCQNCESRAVRRWLECHARLKPVYLGDDLFSRQPVCEAVRAMDGHFLFVCKPSSHQTIEEYLTGVDLPTLTRKIKRGRERFDYRYRWLTDVPLRGDADALTVNWLMIEIVNAAGEVTYRNSFITDLEVSPDTVVDLAACGRARWKIENESFNVLKNNGYNLEHNFGHGKVNLSAVFVSLNLLAFAFHTVCDLAEDLWRRAIEKMGTRGRFFENLRSITTFLIFPTWDDLLATLAFARLPPVAS